MNPDTSRIEQSWPLHGLEHVKHCPYCDSSERKIAYTDVQDWSYYAAPGKWDYWDCTRCSSLYLSPRPTPATLARAYRTYYTHRRADGLGRLASAVERFKERVCNEYWSHQLAAELYPRLHLPRAVHGLLRPLQSRLVEPFETAELLRLSPGRLMDVGCGNGRMLETARRLGWTVMGLDTDPGAVRSARERGLDVLEGSYSRLADCPQQFDCVICSHVLEHVHQPKELLTRLFQALKPGGTVLLSSPNATSPMRYHFGVHWRGLEAPRHLSIPSVSQLAARLKHCGFNVQHHELRRFCTAAESSRIQRRGTRVTRADRSVERRLTASAVPSPKQGYDFAQFACTRP